MFVKEIRLAPCMEETELNWKPKNIKFAYTAKTSSLFDILVRLNTSSLKNTNNGVDICDGACSATAADFLCVTLEYKENEIQLSELIQAE